MCSNGIAAHLNDFRNINLDKFYSDSVSYKVKNLINLRKKSKDAFNYQKSSITECDYDFKNSVFIPLNVCWDTASLGNNNLFNDTYILNFCIFSLLQYLVLVLYEISVTTYFFLIFLFIFIYIFTL